MSETLNMVSDFIGNFGFPIVCVGALFWYVLRKDKDYKETVAALRESLDGNTKALQDLQNRLTGGDSNG